VKILFAGIIARYPFGGVTWCSLMYLLGLRALGHEVFYIEDTGEVVYDPVLDTRSLDPSYGTNYIHQALEPFGLGERWSFFARFDHLFTFGANIGTPACAVPVGDFAWHKTWQPVTLQDWAHQFPPLDRFSTVMTWKIESFIDVGGNKDQEFVKYIDLPSRTAQHFELAINGPQTLLREHGWSTVDAMGISRSLWDYREFIQRSKAEFGVAKHTYVSTRSGWFSDRTECYLASGRPALVQDTGWSSHLPAGEGLLAFSTPDEALAGIDRINSNYPAHARRALDIATEFFAADRVLTRLLAICSR
jgi:hypothetical protein